MNTTSQSTALLSTHPPDTTGLRTLTIPDDDARRRLTPAERLSLTVGLWLLRRSLRQKPDARPTIGRRPVAPRITEHEAITLLTYDLQRQLR